MASFCKNRNCFNSKGAGELGEWSFACKEPNVFPFQKPTFITMRVEDLDKKFASMRNVTETVKQLIIINILFL
jgi:hypothetical protein